MTRPASVSNEPVNRSTPPTPDFSDPEIFKLVLDSLVSPRTSFADRQAIWKQLKDAGKLNDVISSLEQRISASPDSADTAAALGQAYLKKCGTIDDIRQKGIFAMRADEVFDQALAADPSNWDARFYKAVGMSFWPEQLNKGQEVINNFQTLIQQQESATPQPQFAQVYMWLGDQYQKSGASESAAQTWQRGAALFPDNTDLKNRVAGRH